MTLALAGHGVSPGMALGRAHRVVGHELEIGEHRIGPGAVDDEVARLERAIERACDRLEALARSLSERGGRTAEEVVRSHHQMLSDGSIRRAAAEHVRSALCNAEWALQLHLEHLLDEFRRVEDDYLRSRAEDASQVIRLVQGQLDAERPSTTTALPDRLVETLVVARELAPGDLAALHERGVAGVITEHGSPHSHSAIVARSLAIPTIMGVHRARDLLLEGERLVLDGHYGVVFASPDERVLKHYLKKQAESQLYLESLEDVRGRDTVTADGRRIELLVNAERHPELQSAVESGVDGVGLYRTESLFQHGRAPGEEQQLAAFRMAIAMLRGRPLTIRTLDLGGDKGLGSFGQRAHRPAINPALGLRAIRLCLRESELFRTQLRAILRASAAGPVRCLLPMLTRVEEVSAVRALLDDVRRELDEQGHPFDPDLAIGGMIEVPAAALAIDELAPTLDFLSVGTNDLIQYALAADRVDEQVAHLYDPEHLGFVRLLRSIFTAAAEHGLPTTVCGESAGERRYTRLLLALGLDSFSVPTRAVLEVRRAIIETDVGRAREALEDWLALPPDRRAETSLVDAIDAAQQPAD